MRKNFLLWMGVALMMAIGMSSCSSDDDDYSYGAAVGTDWVIAAVIPKYLSQ